MYATTMYLPWVWYSMWLNSMTKMWAPAQEVAEKATATVTPINAAAAAGLDMPSPQEIGKPIIGKKPKGR